jgi:hypothetical protein
MSRVANRLKGAQTNSGQIEPLEMNLEVGLSSLRA